MNTLKRTLILFAAIWGLMPLGFAHPVDVETAQSVASKFMDTNDLQLITAYQTDKNVTTLYVFNTSDGFVIISADDCETPIIAYSHEGRFDPNYVPVQMEEYLQDFVARIQYGIENHVVADEITASQWALVKATGRLNDNKATQAVGPMLTDKWNQGCLYNSLCPTIENAPCDHARVGCVAVAMGQIMHYWNYPTTGWGTLSHTYFDSTYIADIGHTTYEWDHMPDSLTDNSSGSEIEAVATLLLHCGISVDMYYNINNSTANNNKVPNALIRYFCYSKRLHAEKRVNYEDDVWLSMLKNCLDQQCPLYYTGSGSQGGHAFVCDGYDANDLLHFNWGWGTGNGYFALGNLNPNGATFNNGNSAIFDIIPHYEPCLVAATAYPATAGTIEGAGEYAVGTQCTLTAVPKGDYTFHCWKRDGQILSDEPSFTFDVLDDTINMEAHFSLQPVGQVTASYAEPNNPNSSSVNVSWNHADTEWKLLKQFGLDEEIGGMATDGKYIYVTYAEWNNPPFGFGKYTMEGELVEQFNLGSIDKETCLAYDGTGFYCNNAPSYSMLYRVDLDNKTIIDSTEMPIWFGELTYDPGYDGFWLGQNTQTFLYDREGRKIITSPTTSDYIYGTTYLAAEDNNPHLLLSRPWGVYDYDITNNVILDPPLLVLGEEGNYSLGICTGDYDGKEALFIAYNDKVLIYEINRHLAQIVGYRIYRSDSEGNTMLLADGVSGSTYIDNTWNDVDAGVYRFGISEVYFNGVESDIIWSNTIMKSGIGINENIEQEVPDSSVQKVIEDNKIVIIKEGKRYSVSGQRLN